MAQAVEDLLAMEEIRGDSLLRLIKHTIKFGTGHLNNPDHGYSIVAAYDLDLKAPFVILYYLIVLMFVFCTSRKRK